MTTMNISLPDDLKAFVEDEAAGRGFASASEYVMAILVDARERRIERKRLDDLLLEGLDSGPSTPLTSEDWDHIRSEGKKRIAERKSRRE